MRYKKAEKLINTRMDALLQENNLSDVFSYEVKRYKNKGSRGEHDFENKKIFINKDDLYYSILLVKDETYRKYTRIRKFNIDPSITDNIFVTQCHEVVHAKDFSFPKIQIVKKEDLERIALEDLCCTNDKFRRDYYKKLIFEARAISQSINMARDYFINHESCDLETANQRIVAALNVDISSRSKLIPERCRNSQNPKEDYSFKNFAEVEESILNFERRAKSASFTHLIDNAEYQCVIFDVSSILDFSEKSKLDVLNDKVAELGFTNEFYKTLSVTDRLYLHATINHEFYEEYKELNPDARNLPERLQRWSDIGAINPYKLDLEYFQDRLVEFQREKERKLEKEKSPEKEIEPSSGRF